MNTEKLMRDFKVFCLVVLFYSLLICVICAAKVYLGRKGKSGHFDLNAELRAIFSNKNFVYVYSAIFLFTAMYAVKFVVFRVILMFIYLGFIVKLVKGDLSSRGKPGN